MAATKLILVGGFLGAGKTTLLAQAGAQLAARGLRVGLLTNDQAPDLVDTAFLKRKGFNVGEVCGGCFCCKFDTFVEAAGRLRKEHAPEVLLAEPVGSCTDLSATVIQPLKDLAAREFALAPFSVVLDPARLREAVFVKSGRFCNDVQYIYQKQVAEADVVLLNKADVTAPEELESCRAQLAARYPATRVFAVSALRGDGVAAWLDFLLGTQSAGQHLVEVDYDTYASGEAALGWLNAFVLAQAKRTCDWEAFVCRLLENIQAAARAQQAEIAHLKVFVSAGSGTLIANLTRTDGKLSCRTEGQLGAPQAEVTVNARIQENPENLRAMVEQAMRAAAGAEVACAIKSLDSFKPGRPQPRHRYARVV